MKNYRLLTVLFLFISLNCFSQTPIRIEYKTEQTGTYSLYVNNSSQIPYFVIISFTEFKNTKVSPSLRGFYQVYPGRNNLFKLLPEDNEKSWLFNTRYTYLKGSPKAKHNDKLNYLLPIRNMEATRVSYVNNISKTLNQEVSETWKCYSFVASQGDTVYASRRGTVLEVEDSYALAEKSIYFTVKRNYVLILHSDGTMARYQLFENKGIFVEPGDEVLAGEALGIVGGTAIGLTGKIWLMIYQHNPERFRINNNSRPHLSSDNIDRMQDKNDPNKWVYISPNFITSGGVVQLEQGEIYESVHTIEAIQQEMTKREKRKMENK